MSLTGLTPDVHNVHDFQVLAKKKLSKSLYEYLASGTDDEQTLAENVAAFKNWYLRPRVMSPVKGLSAATSLFGQSLSFPLFCTPAGVHALCEEQDGESTTARVCGKMGILFGLSQHSTRSIEEVAAAAPNTNKWYQVYILKDRELTCRLVQRAIQAGYRGIFLTVDSVRFGYREADARNGYVYHSVVYDELIVFFLTLLFLLIHAMHDSWDALPPPHRLVNYDGIDETDIQQPSLPKLEETYNARTHKAWDQNSEMMFEQDQSWADVRWLKEVACPNVPLIVKGIMTAEDAHLALEAGADAIMCSNHVRRTLLLLCFALLL
jgi:(S)-2-hydroxy-acid oxidase